MDGEIPAAVADVGNAETGTQQVAAADAAATKETPTVEPSSTSTAKPDLATLLSDPELRREVLAHPDLAKELDRQLQHRFSSERGRVRAEVEAQLKADFERRQKENDARSARERLSQMDEYELGVQRKKELADEEYAEAIEKQVATKLQERLTTMRESLHTEILQMTGNEISTAVYDLAKEAGATDVELEELDPASYKSLAEFVKGTVKFMGTREGKKLAKEMAKVEAKAMIEEERAAEREKSPTPANLPTAEPGQSDADFAASYASGSNNNTARQLKWMRDNGIPV